MQGATKITIPDGVQGGTGFQFDMTWHVPNRDLREAVVFSGTRRSISTGNTFALTGEISGADEAIVRWNPSIYDLQDAAIHEVQITATFSDGLVRTSPSTWIVWEHSIVGGVVPLPPPGTERFVVIGLAGEMIFLSREDFLTLIDVDPAGSAAAVQANLDTHTGLTGTAVHGLGSASVEDVSAFDAAGSAATVQGNLNTHAGLTNNPHAVTALQAGADPAGSAAAAQAAAIAASDPVGSAATVQGNLNTHTGNATIHFTQAAISIAPAQAGADAAGSAATVQGNLTTHAGLTGTAVHGLGTMATATETNYLLASGTRTGAVSQRQVLTSGVTTPSVRPAADGVTAVQIQTAGGTAVVSVDTTTPAVTIGMTADQRVGLYGVTPVAQQTALPEPGYGVANSGDATTDSIIAKMAARVQALESRLVALGAIKERAAEFTVTTTGAQTLTVNSLGFSRSTVVDWGDGLTDTYTGTATRTHAYAGAGTYTVRIEDGLAVTAFNLQSNLVTLHSAGIASMANVTTFTATGIAGGSFNSADVSAWRPTTFWMSSMPSGYAGTFNSADVSAWRPTTFFLDTMPGGYAGAFNSADVSAWRPTSFRMYAMPSGYAGTFNSTDVSAWRPTSFQLLSMPSG